MSTRPPPPALSSADRVAQAIVRRILRRQFNVGRRLVEADLMREFEAGRSTVREALKSLAASGIVELSHNRGAVVRSLSPQDALELLQVVEVLAGLAARLAGSNIGRGGNRRAFEAAAAPLTAMAMSEDLERALDQRARYYQAMFDIAGNKELERAMPLPRVHLFRTQFYALLTRADIKAMAAEYRAITSAILAGDAAKAEASMRRHVQKSAERALPQHIRAEAI
jgi:DNA-binding GntR family transcriptional regulator